MLRQGRRLLWIEEALAPVRVQVPPQAYRRLINAVAAAVGIEALVTLIDLVGLEREDAIQVVRWSPRALLHAAIEEAEVANAAALKPARRT